MKHKPTMKKRFLIDPNNRKINPDKMTVLKMMVLTRMLPKEEVEKLYGCDYEFTIVDSTITLLEVWFNPEGEHKYKDQYRQCFKMKVPVKALTD